MPYSLHPAVQSWFKKTFDQPTPPQADAWPAIQVGKDTLIAAPTGSGKTLAAFLAALNDLYTRAARHELQTKTYVVYVSPLKALSNDIAKNLQEPLRGIQQEFDNIGQSLLVRAEVRTGDTPQKDRQRQSKNPPHILVTTPESLYLLLTSDSGRNSLSHVETLIIDEIHALAPNRRGAHLALSIERLQQLVQKPLQKIGLSATQEPIEDVARYLVGSHRLNEHGKPHCHIVNYGHIRKLDLAIEMPPSPLEAVMSGEVWGEIYDRLLQLIAQHKTTLIFVNTRRAAERITHHLSQRLGDEWVTSHHGSLSATVRLQAEQRLKSGSLKALVATASLELGIDIGSVDLVCQIGAPRSIAGLLQRVGRSGHFLGGLPKGRIFPLSRDELVECVAAIDAIQKGHLDRLIIPERPLDVLAQQLAAESACTDIASAEFYDVVRRAFPYRALSKKDYTDVVNMLATGFSTRRGQRAALVHYDAVNERIRGRRGTRLTALTSGGAIPDNADYSVILEPSGTFIGTINEDFAIESMAGDIFLLGNTSWRILKIETGKVRVEDAQGQPPTLPFWLGEAPSRTPELSEAVAHVRQQIDEILESATDPQTALIEKYQLDPVVASQLLAYLQAAKTSLGLLPSQQTLVTERFFDEAGGMQLVLHTPFGGRINRAWGLALRKCFCRTFNFELQAAANEDAIILSLGAQHSFPLDDVFRFLSSKTVREILVQALLAAPMFQTRWRWNASRSLAIPRRQGGKPVPPQIQRMQAEDLVAAVFPDQLACLENIVGDREVPDHPLVTQTIGDCLTEAMDIDSLEDILRRIENGSIRTVGRDLPEPSALSHEILNSKPYTFLDDAPLEERRTRAVYVRRSLDNASQGALGILDQQAIQHVSAEAWPQAHNADEVHDALLGLGVLQADEIRDATWLPHLEQLIGQHRVQRFALDSDQGEQNYFCSSERRDQIESIYPQARWLTNKTFFSQKIWDKDEALREVVRGRLEASGPTTEALLAHRLALDPSAIEIAMLALEAEGFVLRGQFIAAISERQWCCRHLLARIHSLTLRRLRAEIEPVTAQDFMRYLLVWQDVDTEPRPTGADALFRALEKLDGFEAPATAWEDDLLPLRLQHFDTQWLDFLCATGKIAWGRLSATTNQSTGPIRSTPIGLYCYAHLPHWLRSSTAKPLEPQSSAAQTIHNLLKNKGALFFNDLCQKSGLLPTQVEEALGELVASGLVTSDSFAGLRALVTPEKMRQKQKRFAGSRMDPTHIANAGRWSLLETSPDSDNNETFATLYVETLLKRYGIIFRQLLVRENSRLPWRDVLRLCRRLEAQGQIRGGRFVQGFSGEQFALPDAVQLLRSVRKKPHDNKLFTLSATDPLNLLGIILPGDKLAALANNRLVLQNGLVICVVESGEPRWLVDKPTQQDAQENLVAALRKPKRPTLTGPFFNSSRQTL